MKIYHGSDIATEEPKIMKNSRLLDFGIGFYTTSNKEQAICWAEIVCKRNNSARKQLSVYKFDLEKAKSELKVTEFISADKKWLDYITANRRGKTVSEKYDIALGPVADDNVYLAVKLFEAGVLDTEEALSRLKVEKLFDQVLFHTEKGLAFCIFDHCEELEDSINGEN